MNVDQILATLNGEDVDYLLIGTPKPRRVEILRESIRRAKTQG